MDSGRLARALLALYPRAWQARYGDELLALVADSGLSTRAVLNIAAAAGAERVRAVAALVRDDLDPAPAPFALPRPFREQVAECIAFMGLAGLTVLVLTAAGIHRPPLIWWYVTFSQWEGRRRPSAALASWAERAAAHYCWFATAVALTGLAWVIGGVLVRTGVPQPSDRLFVTIVGMFALAAGIRMLYCLIRMLTYGSTWPGMHAREIHVWNIIVFVIVIVTGMVDPATEAFWPVAMIFLMVLRPPADFTRAGAARRRALDEAIERRASRPV